MKRGVIYLLLVLSVFSSCMKKEYVLPTSNPLDAKYTGEQFIFIDSTKTYYDVYDQKWEMELYQHVNTTLFGDRTSHITVCTNVYGTVYTWSFQKDVDVNHGSVKVLDVLDGQGYDCELYVVSGDATSRSYFETATAHY